MEETLGQLAPQENKEDSEENINIQNPDLSAAKNLTIQVRHTFLTDIPAEKAGPQPAVLIPTTEFLDPVIYANKAPEPGTKQSALYNALLNYIGIKLEKTNPSYSVITQLPRNNLNIGSLTIQNVAHTKELDAQYKNIIQTINDKLQRLKANQTVVQEIKNSWITKQMNQTGSDTGTALLLQKGLELFAQEENQNPIWYLEVYNYIQSASAQDFLDIMDYFPVIPAARVYSKDSKK